jgi:hypothetical protein
LGASTRAGRTGATGSGQTKYYSALNGYSRVAVDRHRWRADFVAADVKRPDGQAHLEVTHVVEDRRPGALTA